MFLNLDNFNQESSWEFILLISLLLLILFMILFLLTGSRSSAKISTLVVFSVEISDIAI